jgi:hypothetical protein
VDLNKLQPNEIKTYTKYEAMAASFGKSSEDVVRHWGSTPAVAFLRRIFYHGSNTGKRNTNYQRHRNHDWRGPYTPD